MKKSSSIDNPFFRLMGAIGDLVVLNILWLVVLAAGIAALAGLRAASAQDDVFTGLLAAASFLLLAGVCCCGCWGLALLARLTYRHGLLALLDGARLFQSLPAGLQAGHRPVAGGAGGGLVHLPAAAPVPGGRLDHCPGDGGPDAPGGGPDGAGRPQARAAPRPL